MNAYEDIIHLSRPVSRRAKMTALNRAAQFAPFAALTVYDAAIRETGRLTQRRRELDENEKERVNGYLRFLAAHSKENLKITVTYFEADERKEGGSYRAHTGLFRKIDPYLGTLCFEDGTAVLIEEIYGISMGESVDI